MIIDLRGNVPMDGGSDVGIISADINLRTLIDSRNEFLTFEDIRSSLVPVTNH